jgi:hypothetical protein
MNMQIHVNGDEADVPLYLSQGSVKETDDLIPPISENTIVKKSHEGVRCMSSQGVLKR